MQVTLTRLEVASFAPGGVFRFMPGVFAEKGFRATWDDVMEGYFAEVAVAKYLGVFLSPDNAGQPDINWHGQKIEVRRTDHAKGHLILKEKDAGDAVFVLVTGRCPRYEIAGWAIGADGKQAKFERPGHATSPPTWWIPAAHLRAAGTLERNV